MMMENDDGIGPNKKADPGLSELTEESIPKEVLLLTAVFPSQAEWTHLHPSRFDFEVTLINE